MKLHLASTPLAVLPVIAAFSLTFCNQSGPAPALPREAFDPPQGVERAVLASAPDVPPPIARNYATRVILDLEIKEHVKELSEGVPYTYWTFGDEAPGKFIRVREGDLVEVRLKNHPDNSLAQMQALIHAAADDETSTDIRELEQRFQGLTREREQLVREMKEPAMAAGERRS